VNIWHSSETPGYHKTKANMGFNRWRILIVERTDQLTSRDDAVSRLHQYGLKQLGLDYENQVTAEEVSQKLAAIEVETLL
jgi:hypothetical protein